VYYSITVKNTDDGNVGEKVMDDRDTRRFLFYFILEVLEINKEHPMWYEVVEGAADFLSTMSRQTRQNLPVEIELVIFNYEVSLKEVKLN
jgi:hypothetical protein